MATALKSSPGATAGSAILLCALGWGSLSPATARAQEKADAAPSSAEGDMNRARALARQASEALESAKSYAEALDYATRAEALYHAPFHVGIMGEALYGMGRVAEAMAVFERLVSEPLPPSAPKAFVDAQENARKRLRELTARVPSLLVSVKGPRAHVAKVTIDGKVVSFASGVATRFDPGARKVRVEAPGYAPFEQTVTLPARGGVVVVEAPLELEGVSAPKAPATTGGAGPPVVPAKLPSPAPGIAVLAVGGASLVVGGVVGGLFLSRLSSLKAKCPANQCPLSDQDEAHAIGTLGNVSTATLVIGGVGVAAGAVVLIVQRAGSRPARPVKTGVAPPITALAVRVLPGGVTLGGSF